MLLCAYSHDNDLAWATDKNKIGLKQFVLWNQEGMLKFHLYQKFTCPKPTCPKPTSPKTNLSQTLVEGGGKSGYEKKLLWHPFLLTGRKRIIVQYIRLVFCDD